MEDGVGEKSVDTQLLILLILSVLSMSRICQRMQQQHVKS